MAAGTPLLAASWWLLQWFTSVPGRLLMALVLAGMVSWILAPIAWYFELINWVCGPRWANQKTRKGRRRIRVRLERYVGEST